MRLDFSNVVLFAIVAYVGYFIYSQNEIIKEQESIMQDQFDLIETQRAFILEINKMLGIQPEMYWYKPNSQPKDNPLHTEQI